MRLSDLNKLILSLCCLSLAACNGGSSSGDSGSGGGGTNSSVSLTGGGIKGPLVDAIVTVYKIDTTAADFKGEVVGTPGSTNEKAQIIDLVLPAPIEPPYILEFTSDDQTTDILTGKPPVISEMRTVLTQALLDGGEQIYATPLTTMAVDLAIKNADNDGSVNTAWALSERDLDLDDDGTDDLMVSLGDTNATSDELLSALPIAAAQIKSTMGFGMDESIDIFDTPPLIDDTTDTGEKQENAAAYRAAVEAVTAVVDQIDAATGTDDANSVLSALTNDLADGQIDGKEDGETSEIFGGSSDDAEETATASLQLLEQDPATLPIPNDPLGRTVGEMKQVINDEKEDLGNDGVETEIDTKEEVVLKPAETDPDLDDDGVPNDKDAFPEDATETVDTDGDGTGNNADTDDDNDGVKDPADPSSIQDGEDAFPLDASEQIDTDGDGIGNNADTDDDGDGTEDIADDFPLDVSRQSKSDQDNDDWPAGQDVDDTNASLPGSGTPFIDTDGDGLANSGGLTDDTDDDNDGVIDDEDAFPLDKNEQKDTDGDGTGDNADNDIDGDGVANADDKFPRNPFETIDTDRDGIGNNADEDDDGDGVDDAQEIQNGSNPLKRDTDGDGVLDNVDQAPNDPSVQFDSDADGIDNNNDNCPVHYNPTQANIDGDERGDACDKDKDGDGVDNNQDAFPEDKNESLDTDGDGLGNNADPDDDNDGVEDGSDAFSTDASESKDTDGDGTGDNADEDIDGDGVNNDQDAFPNDSTETTDTDGDGIGNNADGDIDGDGVANEDDAAPLNASASTDTDGDGEPDVTDTDDDNDGTPDTSDAFSRNANEDTDTDGDGIGDNSDTDIDGDGVANEDDRFPTDKNEYLDTDNDGTGDNADTDIDGDNVNNDVDAFPLNPSESVDTDKDGLGNNADSDDDNDGLSDSAEGTAGSNPLLRDTDGDGRRDGADNCPINANVDQKDRDGDSQGDACDTDDDGDGVADVSDNCPAIPNANQANLDNDSEGDACDNDRDGDTVLNSVDNCPIVSNTDQTDDNHNGIGDACDANSDSDSIVDELDNCPQTTNQSQSDIDSDGQGDACDVDRDGDGTNNDQDAFPDDEKEQQNSDGDTLGDNADNCPQTTNEDQLDTDNDGFGDACDTNDQDADGVTDDIDNCPAIANGANEDNQLNTDGDALGNACDKDDDGDGVNDSVDAFPLNEAESQDQDDDQIGDNADNCPVNANNDQTDTDGDGIGNACDLDNDNDGVADEVDNCPAQPNPGQINTDQDEQGNACDTDDDGDSVEDGVDNCPLVANTNQDNQDQDDHGDACDNDRDGDGLSNAEEAALGTDASLVDSDLDGVNDGVDNCPATGNSDQLNTDGDAKGNACDNDDDNDGTLDSADAFPLDDTEDADADGDTVGDNADNCPVTANEDQADSDGDQVGDVCDDLPQVTQFYLNQRLVNSETETDTSGVEGGICPFNEGDEMTRVSLWLQDGAAIKVSFGDEGLMGDASEVSIDTAGNISATITDRHEGESGAMDLSLVVNGQVDSSSGLITATVVETFTFEDASGSEIASCVYNSTETFTPMAQATASSIFDGQSGSNVGFVWMDAFEDYRGDESGSGDTSGETAAMSGPSFEFSYGIIDDTDETEFVYDASASSADKWVLRERTDNSFMLGSSGWVSVADQHVVEGTPSSTLNLVAKDESDNILANWLVTPFSANVSAEPMLGLVPREWSEEGLTAPEEVFAESDVLAVGIHAVSQLDVYEIRCPDHEGMDAGESALDCQNAMLKSGGASGLEYATALGDIIHSSGTGMTQKWQGVPAGYMEEGEVFAYLTGSDASGAEGSTGTAAFYMSRHDTGALLDLGVISTWTIEDPLENDSDLLIQFTLPELVNEQFDEGERPDAMIVALLADSSDSQLYVRGGHFREAGRHFYESGLNGPALEEVKGNFSYVGDTDGDGLKDDVDTDDDGDGVPDDEDAFPLNKHESEDTDGDDIGNNEDTDDDGDGILDTDEAAQGTDPLVADSDEDGVNDGIDNCPTIANGVNEDNQADSDGNDIGDACDGVADISGLWRIQREVSAIDHSGNAGLCEGEVGELEAAIVLLKQSGANVEVLFADNGFTGDGDHGTVNAAGTFSWETDDDFNNHDHQSGTVTGSVSETWTFTGTADDSTAPAVLSDSAALEVNSIFDGEDQSGTNLATCRYTYDASMTRMEALAASDVLDISGNHGGFVYLESDRDWVEETGKDVYEFEYGVVDDNGESLFLWDDETQDWVEETKFDTRYMLGASGWVAVDDVVQVSGTPAATADLVITDGSENFSTLRLSAFSTGLSGLPFEGFVDEDFLEQTASPEGSFANANSAAFVVEAENLSDAYAIECDIHDPNYQDLGLACSNAYIPDWTNWPEFSQTDLATSLAEAIHTNGVKSSIGDKGLWIGRGHHGESVYAFLTGSDTSGAAGTSGTVGFSLHFHNAAGDYTVETVQHEGADVEAVWTSSMPSGSSSAIVSFEIPEFLLHEFDIEWRETPRVILTTLDAGDTQSFLRFGGMKPAGAVDIFPMLNLPALQEVIAGFDYVRPDTDGDGVADNEDNCPADANADQDASACESTGGTGETSFTVDNIEGDFVITFPANGEDPESDAYYTFLENNTGTVFFEDGPQEGEAFVWSIDGATLVLDITTQSGSHDWDEYTLTGGTIEDGTIRAVIDEGNNDSVEYDGSAIWKRDHGKPDGGACTTGDVLSGAVEADYDQAVIDCGGLKISLLQTDVEDSVWYSEHSITAFDAGGTGTFHDRNSGIDFTTVWSIDTGFIRFTATASDSTTFSRKLGIMNGELPFVSSKFFNDGSTTDYIASMQYAVSSDPTDTDSDQIPDDIDNCPNDVNADQADSNMNGIGDACDSEGMITVTLEISVPDSGLTPTYTGEVSLPLAEPFKTEHAPGVYDFMIDGGGTNKVTLLEGGTGSIEFSPSDINPIVWSISESGVLSFTENFAPDEQWFFTITPVHHSDFDSVMSVSTPEGQVDFANGTLLADFHKNGGDVGTEFSESELSGSTRFNIYFDDTPDDGGDPYYIMESMTFNSDGSFNATHDSNAQSRGETDYSGTWSIVDGDLVLVEGLESTYISVLSIDSTLGARLVCWGDGAPCTDDTEWFFDSQALAEAYLADKNGTGPMPTISDADSDGILDDYDAFADDSSQQFDTDGDGKGDNPNGTNGDSCPYTSDETCASVGVDMSGEYLLSWTIDGTDTSNETLNDEGTACIAETELSGYQLTRVKQVGNQVIMESGEGNWMMFGTIAANGDFTLSQVSMGGGEDLSMSANFDGSGFSGSFNETDQNAAQTVTCSSVGTFSGLAAAEVTESDIDSTGVTWFDLEQYENQDESGSQTHYDLEYGTLSGALETMFEYDVQTSTWVDTSAEERGSLSLHYVTASGIQRADDLFIIDSYGSSGEGANVKVTDDGLAVDLEDSLLELAELDVSGLPLKFIFEQAEDIFADGAEFSTGASVFIGEVMAQSTAYAFECHDDSTWAETNLDCGNFIRVGSDSSDGSPIPAASFADIFSTHDELFPQAASQAVVDRGLWLGQSYDMGGSFHIRAYLESTSGDGSGLDGDQNAGVGFEKVYDHVAVSMNIGDAAISSSMIGSIQVVEFEVPELVAQIGRIDQEDRRVFLFVDDSETSGPIVRMGNVILSGDVEQELLFNSIARDDIAGAIDLPSPPGEGPSQSFISASDNGVNFTADNTIDHGISFGVAGFGILREFDTASGHEVNEYYVFDEFGGEGRYVFEEIDGLDAVVDSADEAMSWSVDSLGNLDVTITSSGDKHQIALMNFDDTYRPQIVVLNPHAAVNENYSERLVQKSDFEFEVANRLALSGEPLDDTTFTFINRHEQAGDVETMNFNADGSWEWLKGGLLDESAAWSASAVDNFITLSFTDEQATIAIEDKYADSEDVDEDLNNTELIYLFTGWSEIDSASGLGSFFRDEYFKN